MGVQTGASVAYDCVAGLVLSSFQAAGTSIWPVPWETASTPLTKSAVEYSDSRICVGVMGVPVEKPAERSSAAPPAACGEAIEVPLNIA